MAVEKLPGIYKLTKYYEPHQSRTKVYYMPCPPLFLQAKLVSHKIIVNVRIVQFLLQIMVVLMVYLM